MYDYEVSSDIFFVVLLRLICFLLQAGNETELSFKEGDILDIKLVSLLSFDSFSSLITFAAFVLALEMYRKTNLVGGLPHCMAKLASYPTPTSKNKNVRWSHDFKFANDAPAIFDHSTKGSS